MTEAEMMQRVVAILTQAQRAADALELAEGSASDLNPDAELAGELIRDTMNFSGIEINSRDPQAIADAVADVLTRRVGLLAACFVGAFARLAFHHDAGDMGITSEDVLRQMALEAEQGYDD